MEIERLVCIAITSSILRVIAVASADADTI